MAAIPKSIRRVVAILAVAAVVEIFVVPQFAGARQASHTLAGVNPLLLTLGLALEVAALVAYFQLTRSLIPPRERQSL